MEQRYALGVAYPADQLDGHGEFMTPEDVEQAAWGFLRLGPQVGLYHADGTIGHAQVVESYIYRGPDWQLGDQTVHAGDWLLGVIFDPDTWELVKAGRIVGWSIQGIGSRIPDTEIEEQ
jgi:hypothetical protein